MHARFPLLILLLLLCSLAHAQPYADIFPYPMLKTTGKNIAQFIPRGWHLLTKAKGDLHGDKLSDYAVVIEFDKDLNPQLASGEENTPGNMHKPRIFFILFAQKTGGYILSVQSNDLIRCADDGGMFDPFEDLTIEHGTVLVHHYGGSAWRWDIKARFRFQQNAWYLIGLTDLTYWDVNGEMTVYDYNLLTGKMSTTKGNCIDDTAPKKVTWKTLGKRKLLLTHYQKWYDCEWQKMVPQ